MASNTVQLHQYIQNDDLQGVRRLVLTNKRLITQKVEGITPLMLATKLECAEIVSILLENKAPVNVLSDKYQQKTALHIAVEKQNRKIVKLLLDAKGDPGLDITTNIPHRNPPKPGKMPIISNKTALHFAAVSEDSDILHLLLLAGANPNIQDTVKQTALSIAIANGNIANAVILIGFGGGLPRNGIRCKQEELIENATRYTPSDLKQQMKLTVQKRLAARDTDHQKSPSQFLYSELSTNFRKDDGSIDLSFAIYWSLEEEHYEIFEYLYAIDPNLINACDEYAQTVLHLAVIKGSEVRVKAILNKDNVVVDCRSATGETPLYHAVRNKYTPIIELLLEHGADPMLWSQSRTQTITPLRYAYKKRGTPESESWEVYKKLVDACILSAVETGSKETSDLPLALTRPRNSNTSGCTQLQVSQADPVAMESLHSNTTSIRQLTINTTMHTKASSINIKLGDPRLKIAIIGSGIIPEYFNEMTLCLYHHLKRQPRKDNNKFPLYKELEPVIHPIKEYQNFIPGRDVDDIEDTSRDPDRLDIENIINRLAPSAYLYIARVYDSSSTEPNIGSTAKSATKAILWAIKQNVGFISLSLGFDTQDPEFQDALKRAVVSGIMVLVSAPSHGLGRSLPRLPYVPKLALASTTI